MASIATETGGRALPRIHWSAIAAGVLVALASHIVLGLFGAALGFAAAPADSEALGAGAAIWALITPLVASLLGAWIACRVADQRETAGANLHGVLVWCIGLIAGALFLTGTLASGAMSAGTAASGNVGALRSAVQGGSERVDPGAAQTQAEAERAEDAAGKAGATAMGGAAMAAIAGLLGALAGAALARASGTGQRKGLGWKIAVQRTDDTVRRERGYTVSQPTTGAGSGMGERLHDPVRPYGTAAEARPGQGTLPGDDPYAHH
jgi:MFS family permease